MCGAIVNISDVYSNIEDVYNYCPKCGSQMFGEVEYVWSETLDTKNRC